MGEGGMGRDCHCVCLSVLSRSEIFDLLPLCLSLSHSTDGGGRHRHAHAPICAHGREGVRKRCLPAPSPLYQRCETISKSNFLPPPPPFFHSHPARFITERASSSSSLSAISLLLSPLSTSPEEEPPLLPFSFSPLAFPLPASRHVACEQKSTCLVPFSFIGYSAAGKPHWLGFFT